MFLSWPCVLIDSEEALIRGFVGFVLFSCGCDLIHLIYLSSQRERRGKAEYGDDMGTDGLDTSQEIFFAEMSERGLMNM